jgi:predicted Zn-dependent peptidase
MKRGRASTPALLSSALVAALVSGPACGRIEERGAEPPSPVEAIHVQVDFPRHSATTARLDNGLEVILVENHANPLVASMAIVRAGSRFEDFETSGASHYLEHLLFNGTERRTQEQLYDEVDRIGGYNNATTGRDQTTFMMLAPAEHASRALDIQADMLFGSTLPPEKFEKERGILVEEIGKDNDRAETLADQSFQEALYGDTPYGLPILGTLASVAHMSRDRVYEYYKALYVPNNMIVMVIGDFETSSMLDLVRRSFGEPPPKTLPLRPTPAPPSLDRDVVRVRHGRAERAYLNIGFEAPPLTSPDYPAFAALAEILGSGDNSRLHQALRGGASPRVYDVSTDLDASRDFSRLVVRAVCPPEADLGAIIETVVTQLKQFVPLPPSPQELRRVVAEMRVRDLAREEQLHFFGMFAAPYLANADYEFLRDYTSLLARVTPSDIERIARAYFSEAHYVAAALLPDETAGSGADPAGETRPDSLRAGGDWARTVLPNGFQLLVRQDAGSQVFAMHLMARDRSLHEPDGKDGIADLLHHAIVRGTVVHRGPELASALQNIGATVKAYDDPAIPYDDYYTTPAFSYVRFETVDEYAEEAMRLLTEMVRRPALKDEDILAVRGELVAQGEEAEGQTGHRARRLFLESLWPGHPYGRLPAGTPSTLAAISPEDLRSFHEAYFAPGNLILAVRTGRPPEMIERVIRSLWADARDPARGARPVALPPTPSPTPVERRERMGKQQSVLMLGRLLGPVPDEDRAPLMALASIASAEMSFELRERKGLAYSLGLDVNVDAPVGWIAARMGTRPQNIDEARAGLRAAIRGIQSASYTEDEVTRARNRLLGQRLMRRMSRVNQAYGASLGQLFRADPSADANLTAALRAVTPADLRRVATRYFGGTDPLVEIIVE